MTDKARNELDASVRGAEDFVKGLCTSISLYHWINGTKFTDVHMYQLADYFYQGWRFKKEFK